MTSERARYILETRSDLHGCRFAFPHEFVREGTALHEDGITREEDEYIKQIWMLMGQDKSYYDAVCAIAKGV